MIRPVTANDVPGIKQIIDDNELFPSELLDDMISPYLSNESKEIWLTETTESGNEEIIVSIVYCAPERMTEGTWNALLLAVLPEFQRKGYGSRLMKYLESSSHLQEEGARILLVETSGSAEFASQRTFYETKLGYKNVATIPEFYQANEDKVVFWKHLQLPSTEEG